MNKRDFRGELAVAVASFRKRDEASRDTRDLIVAFGAEIDSLIQALEPKDVAAIELRVRALVRHGPGEVKEPVQHLGLDIDELPALDDPGIERRPHAIGLFLEAFSSEASDYIYFELRSNPGLLVSAAIRTNKNTAQFFEVQRANSYFEDVRGIRRNEHNEIKLVSLSGSGDGNVKDTFTASGVFGAFLNCIESLGEYQAKYNAGIVDSSSGETGVEQAKVQSRVEGEGPHDENDN